VCNQLVRQLFNSLFFENTISDELLIDTRMVSGSITS